MCGIRLLQYLSVSIYFNRDDVDRKVMKTIPVIGVKRPMDINDDREQ